MESPSLLEQLFPFILVGGIFAFFYLRRGSNSKNLFCLECHSVDSGKNEVKGHFLIEVILWLCFLVPGIIYTIWRTTNKQKVCRTCGSKKLIPSDSPRAREIIDKKPEAV